MQLSSLPVVAAIAALYMAVGIHAAECTVTRKTPNCCWGDRDGGSQACKRQRAGDVPNAEWRECEWAEEPNWCSTVGITKEQCSADCCDTITGWGIPCPD